MKLKLILTTAIVGMALALPSMRAPRRGTATKPTLSLQRDCEVFPGFNSVEFRAYGPSAVHQIRGNPGAAGR